MSAPKRIQLRRTKGWRKPEGAVVVARPSKWGNPYKVGGQMLMTNGAGWTQLVTVTRGEAVEMFRRHAVGDLYPFGYNTIRAELAGRDLACWCPLDQPCHADVLLEIANGGTR